MTNVGREHSVDQGLISNAPTFRFLTEAREDGRIQPDRNKLTGTITKRRSADASHRTKLIARSLRKIGEINLSGCPRTRTFLSGSLAAR